MRHLFAPALITSFLFVTLSACDQGPQKRADEWPPMVGWAQENFRENRSSLEALESMLLASKYTKVSGPGLTYGEYFLPDGTIHEERIEKKDAWLELFRKSTVFAVAAEDGYTAYPTGLNPFSPDIVISSQNYEEVLASDEYQNMLFGTLTYIHDRESLQKPVPCDTSHRASKCGACTVDLAPNWMAYFTWSAASLTPSRIEEESDGSLTQDEIDTLSDEAYEACFASWEKLTTSADE